LLADHAKNVGEFGTDVRIAAYQLKDTKGQSKVGCVEFIGR